MLLSYTTTIIIFIMILVIMFLLISYYFVKKKKWQKTKKKVKVFLEISEVERKIIDIIVDNNQISIFEIAEKIKLSLEETQEIINDLIENELISYQNKKWGIFK